MMDVTALLAAQPPDDQRLTISIIVFDLASPPPVSVQMAAAQRAPDRFLAVDVKFPAVSFSNLYLFVLIIFAHTLLLGIILGYSRAGKPGGARAFWLGGNSEDSDAPIPM